MEKLATIWEFETKNFRVEVNALIELDDPNDQFDESIIDDVVNGINTGRYVWFCAESKVILKEGNIELGSDYLGGCCYKSYDEFRDHVGINVRGRADGHNYGSYFSDMVREAITAARGELELIRQAICEINVKAA